MTSSEFENFLTSIKPKPLHVLDASIPKSQYIALDLSERNTELQYVDVSSSEEFSIYINSYLKQHNAKVAYGGYNELRNIYSRSTHFDSLSEKRNIHLGIDLWCAEGTSIFTPIDGEIHSFKNNTNYGDYGPTIILKHNISGTVFYTLYGHLSLASIANLKVGETFSKGEQLAFLGDATVNGDYPPHLHFQIIKDIEGYLGDYPGVSSKKDLEFYLQNCPNPLLFLGF
jgi:murein DD-endopeptidase MepM/ murein hydrolase activator NlpD